MDLDEILHLLAKRWGKEATAEEERDLRRWLREHPREAMWIRMMEAAGSPHRPGPPDDGARPWTACGRPPDFSPPPMHRKRNRRRKPHERPAGQETDVVPCMVPRYGRDMPVRHL